MLSIVRTSLVNYAILEQCLLSISKRAEEDGKIWRHFIHTRPSQPPAEASLLDEEISVRSGTTNSAEIYTLSFLAISR